MSLPGSSQHAHTPLNLPGTAPALLSPNRPDPRSPFRPSADTSTYRDLLMFEERLKMNAEMLARRRRRYSIFLWSFVLALVVMAHRLGFAPPTSLGLLRALQGSLAVVLITLALFFASGMYEQKIRYAHSYITHSNKALRPLNMHLNMRRPRPSFFHYLPASLRPASPSPRGKPGRRPSTTVMAQIPPSTNPRGELIFSSRVDRTFREGYERYRAAFERRREERAREGKAQWWWTWTASPPISRRGTPPSGQGSSRGRTPSPLQLAEKDHTEEHSQIPSALK